MRSMFYLKPFTLILITLVIGSKAKSECKVEESISDEAGYKQLKVGAHKLLDVDSFKVLDNKVFYAVSPIYGKPEVGVIDCQTDKKVTLVYPKNKVKGYPDGSDYFRLKDISKDGKKGSYVIRYYYVSDVDGQAFKSLENKKNLRSVKYPKQ